MSHIDNALIIVRHPLSRLVSAYHSKLVRMGFTHWENARKRIIRNYRPNGEDFLRTEEELYGGKTFENYMDDPRVVT